MEIIIITPPSESRIQNEEERHRRLVSFAFRMHNGSGQTTLIKTHRQIYRKTTEKLRKDRLGFGGFT